MRRPTLLLAALCLTGLAPALVAQTPSWTRVRPTASPPDISHHKMVYDSARQRVVLFGGWTLNAMNRDTWEYDGKTWTKMRPRTVPDYSLFHEMAYDSARRRTVMIGSFAGKMKTYEWDGTNWTAKQTRDYPSVRSEYAMVYDASRRVVVLYGGTPPSTHGGTWEYDGNDWKEIRPRTNPGYRYHHAMAYDASRRRVVLFGGAYKHSDTWEWDGVNWVQYKRTTAPWARIDHEMTYDAARQRVLVFGGYTGRTLLNDTWEWDGNTWTEIKSTSAPAGRTRHAMVYDSARQRAILFGGGGVASYSDTWELGTTPTLTTNLSTISYATGGSQRFTLRAGAGLRNRPYIVFGSITGSRPGVLLSGIHIPLNPDHYTSLLIGTGNSTMFAGFRGTLSATGTAAASLNVPKGLPVIPTTLHHAFVVYDGATHRAFTASNPVALRLR